MTLSVDDDPHACVRAFVDELARSGVTDACVCPGSRSTPLAMTLRRQERIRLWTHLDERAAAFFAMGMAKATRRPVAVLCTSGTAAVNFAPAVIEAWHARVPLLVLTADRPPELRDIGASQTIDQIRLYGSHVKWSVDLALPDTEAGARYARTAARRAVAIAGGDGVPGPVHLNFPFREPLVPTARPPAAAAATPDLDTWPSLSGLPDADLARLAQVIRNAMRGLIVCGPQDDPSFAPAVAGLAGGLFAMAQGGAYVQVMSLQWSGAVVLMTLIGGGLVSFWGPVVGTIVYFLARDLLGAYTESWLLWFGLMFMLVVMFKPEGVAGLWHDLAARRAARRRARAGTLQPATGD